jgi:hypothetical protein
VRGSAVLASAFDPEGKLLVWERAQQRRSLR